MIESSQYFWGKTTTLHMILPSSSLRGFPALKMENGEKGKFQPKQSLIQQRPTLPTRKLSEGPHRIHKDMFQGLLSWDREFFFCNNLLLWNAYLYQGRKIEHWTIQFLWVKCCKGSHVWILNTENFIFLGGGSIFVFLDKFNLYFSVYISPISVLCFLCLSSAEEIVCAEWRLMG